MPSWFGQCISQKVENAHLHISTMSHIWGFPLAGVHAGARSLHKSHRWQLAPWWNWIAWNFWMLSKFEVWNVDINGDVENWHLRINEAMEMLKTDIWESMKQWRCWKLTSESIESMKQRIAEHRLRPSIHLINFKASPCQFFLMAHQTTSMRWTSSWVDRWRRLRNKANPAFWISVIVCNIINHEPWNSYCRQDTRSTT